MRVNGQEDMRAFARRMKDAGNREFRKELQRRMKVPLKPLPGQIRTLALQRLPSSGGLAALVAGSRISIKTKISARGVGARIDGRLSGHDLNAIDRGRLRHPVFGHDRWVTQQVEPGFFTDAVEGSLPKVRRELLDTIDDVAKKVARG